MAADARVALDEREIVDSVLAGDREAFRRLVERESRSVIGVCTRILGDRAEAEDVAQEAFVAAYRALGSWRSEGSFGAWLSRIAVRLAIRRAAQRKQVTWLDPVADANSGGVPAGAAGSDPADPAGMVIRSERDAQLRAAVAALEEPYREVVALRFFADRSLAEIADVTERPLGTVKTHLHRGLARLRLAIEEAER
jgi:RNA polymerase sigma-70 factor (ECF subfamily)